jgi:hypothetical protein
MGHSLTAASSTSWVGFGEKHEGRKITGRSYIPCGRGIHLGESLK